MFDRFAKAARGVVTQAQEEARELGARSIEAEHLLLALSLSPDVGPAMDRVGAGHDDLLEALELETASALETVGVSLRDYGSVVPVRTRGNLRFGTSAKRTLEQTLRVATRRDGKTLETEDLLVALLLMDHGTVPRALAVAGIDRDLLLREVRG
jgi:ATP-dependent Clp protease ATP-binding subunit ClpA